MHDPRMSRKATVRLNNGEWANFYGINAYEQAKACRERQENERIRSAAAVEEHARWVKRHCDTPVQAVPAVTVAAPATQPTAVRRRPVKRWKSSKLADRERTAMLAALRSARGSLAAGRKAVICRSCPSGAWIAIEASSIDEAIRKEKEFLQENPELRGGQRRVLTAR